ncbi:ABC transporter substrate-binding protein [Labedaea rhizosphaerae]|uniref:Peptide/nickel transport system substrate-binding protein n=1 Tax=Labedaea rhizosphaerae TaxID=598644 RepID=A0A4R6SAV5_LABRH|nr:ABC transporter substrate-binding protein [Labedaea rhizosphaerae]TDP97169.1 peptide/nickel transport system substrate-binding protein [Labedaea rhizosphaerae]
MGRGIQRAIPLAATAGAVAVLAGCTADPAPTASGDLDGTSIVIAVSAEPASLNPLAGYAPHGSAKLYDGLLEYQPDMQLHPLLATDLPEPSADGRSWTVKLRTGVTFSDGSKLDADDVSATYRAVLTPAYASPLRGRFSMLTAVTQVDSTTVRFDLSRPYSPFPQLLTLGIVPSQSLTTPVPVTGGRRTEPPPGTGPYRLASWTKGRQLVLTANPKYFGGRPSIAKVTMEFVGDDAARLERVNDGTVDSTVLPCTQAARFADSNTFDVMTQQHTGDLSTVVLPSKNDVTGDQTIRRALNLTVDRAAVVTGVLGGHGAPAYTPVPDATAEFVEPSATFEHNPTQARKLLEEAGWRSGGDGVRTRGGVRAAFTLRYASGDDVAAKLVTKFAADAKQVGIAVTGNAIDPAALHNGAGPSLLRIGGPFDPDLMLYQLLHSPGKPGDYTNDDVDAALETGRTATDPAQRSAAYRQLQRAYVSSPGMVVLASTDHCTVIRRSWNGYRPVPDGSEADGTWGPWWNLAHWTPR